MVEILNPQNILACLTQDAIKANLDGAPILKAGLYSGDAGEYQEVTSWTPGAGKVGVIGEINFLTDDATNTRYKVVIGTVTLVENLQLVAAANLAFPRGTIINQKLTLHAKSNGSDAINANAFITGKEV